MKSLVRWGTAVGLVSSIVVGSFFAGTMRVLALTNEQILETLRSVPVFTITDEDGSPLVASPGDGQDGPPVAGVFISRQDAENFLENLQQGNPDLGRTVQVVPVSLAEVYELAVSTRDRQEPLEFTFVPILQEVEAAVTILREDDATVDQFEGVPLFIARSGQAEDSGYLTIRQGNEQVIPMFFRQEELEALLQQLRQSQPNVANTIDIQVVNLEGLIQTLENSNNPELTQILLVPPRDSIDFVRSLQPGQSQPAPQR